MIEISAFNFTRPIATGAQLRDPTRINIETDNWNPRTRKRDRYRKANIAKSDYRNPASVRHLELPSLRLCSVWQERRDLPRYRTPGDAPSPGWPKPRPMCRPSRRRDVTGVEQYSYLTAQQFEQNGHALAV